MKKSLDVSESENPRSRINTVYWYDKGDRLLRWSPPALILIDSITKLRLVLCRSYIITLVHFKDKAL